MIDEQEGVHMQEGLPKDPVMMLSVVNTKLRDFYDSLDVMCRELDADRQEIEDRLESAGFRYDAERNQFL